MQWLIFHPMRLKNEVTLFGKTRLILNCHNMKFHEDGAFSQYKFKEVLDLFIVQERSIDGLMLDEMPKWKAGYRCRLCWWDTVNTTVNMDGAGSPFLFRNVLDLSSVGEQSINADSHHMFDVMSTRDVITNVLELGKSCIPTFARGRLLINVRDVAMCSQLDLVTECDGYVVNDGFFSIPSQELGSVQHELAAILDLKHLLDVCLLGDIPMAWYIDLVSTSSEGWVWLLCSSFAREYWRFDTSHVSDLLYLSIGQFIRTTNVAYCCPGLINHVICTVGIKSKRTDGETNVVSTGYQLRLSLNDDVGFIQEAHRGYSTQSLQAISRSWKRTMVEHTVFFINERRNAGYLTDEESCNGARMRSRCMSTKRQGSLPATICDKVDSRMGAMQWPVHLQEDTTYPGGWLPMVRIRCDDVLAKKLCGRPGGHIRALGIASRLVLKTNLN